MKDRIVVVTGASSGIGKACAEEYASRGAKIVLADKNYAKLEELARAFKADGTDFLIVEADVSIESNCKNIMDAAIKKYGRIDILINSAGISMRALFEEVDLAVVKKVMDVNFWGTVCCTKYALPYLQKSMGSVVGIASIAGIKGEPGRAGYSASKFAVIGFLEVLRIEHLKKDLHVLIVCPGWTATNIRRSGTLTKDGTWQAETTRDESKGMTPETVARYIANAVEKKKPRLILSKEGKTLVFLNKFFPKLTDKMIYNHLAKEPDSPFK